ncbi:MAG: hypothetical protein AAGJ85_09755, partial [Pseudomonadota bacterium]
TAETMVFGEAVNLPMRVLLNNLAEEYRPHSSSASFTDLWSRDTATPELMRTVYRRWKQRSHAGEARPAAPQAPTAPQTTSQLRKSLRNTAASGPAGSAARPSAAVPRGALNVQDTRAALRRTAEGAGQPRTQSLQDVKTALNAAFHRDSR